MFKKRNIIFILLSILVFLTSCFSDMKENTNSTIKNTNNMINKIEIDELKYNIKNKNIFANLQKYNNLISEDDVEILDMSDNLLYIALTDNSEGSMTLSTAIKYKEIVEYNIVTDKISPIYKFEDDILLHDFTSIKDRYFISYSTNGEYNYYVSEIISGELKKIDSFPGFDYKYPRFARIKDKLFYSYVSHKDDNIVNSIKSYDLLKNKSNVFYSDKDSSFITTELYSSVNNFIAFFENNNTGYFQIYDENDLVSKIPLKKNERVISFTPIKDGLLLSYEDHNISSKFMDNKNEKKKYVTKLKYINIKDNNEYEIMSDKIYSLISIGDNHAMGLDSSFGNYLLEVTDNIIEKKAIKLNKEKGLAVFLIKDKNYYIYEYDSGFIYYIDFQR
ncbi:MAG: hypothetical protein AB2375_05910 [Tissierellaceae bacterium]